MSVFDDETDRFLKRLRALRKDVQGHVLSGVSLEPVVGGYHYELGHIHGLSSAEILFKDVFRNWLQAPEVDPALVEKQQKDDTY